MRVKNIFIVLGVLAVGLSGCAVTDFDRSADFNSYKTYVWGESKVDVSNPLYDSDLINDRIRHTVEEEFFKRGIVKAKRNPDFVVRFQTFTEEQERTSGNYPYGYRFYPYAFYPFAFGWYPYYWMTPPPPNTTQYTEGTLVLDIIDNNTNELVWRGSVSGDVDDVTGLRKQIDKGIRAIMKKYPVSPEAPLRSGEPEGIS